MTPSELALELGIDAKRLRAWLRQAHPRSAAEHGSSWSIPPDVVEDARRHFSAGRTRRQSVSGDGRVTNVDTTGRRSSGQSGSDEAYVLDLCDELLGEHGLRQHRFDWLLGDPGATGTRVRLPVDAYYPQHRLVVEYREVQHDQSVQHFDKPDRLTVSGVHRGIQRRLYDERRETEIPRHGLRLVIIRPADLAANSRGRLLRRMPADLEALRTILSAPTTSPDDV